MSLKRKKDQTSISEWDELLDAYLLGKLSDEEQRAFEEQCFEDDALFEELKFREQVFGLVQTERETLFADYIKHKETRKRSSQDRLRAFILSWPNLKRHSLKVAVSLFALFFIIWLNWPLSKSYQYADISPYKFYLSKLRGNTEVDRVFTKAFETLFRAHRNPLGLDPHYDRAQVELAIDQLRNAFKMAQEGSIRAKIAFFIGKAFLMKDDVSSACQWFQRASSEGRKTFFAKEADDLLTVFDCNKSENIALPAN